VDVHPEVPMKYSVDIYHGYNHEDKHSSEELSSEVVFVEEKVYDSFHSVGGGGLPGVHSCCYEHHWLFKLQRPFFIREYIFVKPFFMILFLGVIFISAGDGK